MKILILSRNPELYSTHALVTAAESRGHEVRVVDYLRCYMNITSRKPRIYVDGEELVADAVIPRMTGGCGSPPSARDSRPMPARCGGKPGTAVAGRQLVMAQESPFWD